MRATTSARASLGFWIASAWPVLFFAQTPSPDQEIAVATKSPASLTRYLESHPDVNWNAIRKALGLRDSRGWVAPCGAASVSGNPCSSEIVRVPSTNQEVVILGGENSFAVEYLGYVRDNQGGWHFSGERNYVQRNGPTHHDVVRRWDRPFLVISSNHSENGIATEQILEEWFDLTRMEWKPVFEFTREGSQGRFGFGVSRDLRSVAQEGKVAGTEMVELTVSVHFVGIGLDQEMTLVGFYEREKNQPAFTLREAFSGADRKQRIGTTEFAALADPFSAIENERLLALALPGLERIAMGSDKASREWLNSILNFVKDTPEKRKLIELLKR